MHYPEQGQGLYDQSAKYGGMAVQKEVQPEEPLGVIANRIRERLGAILDTIEEIEARVLGRHNPQQGSQSGATIQPALNDILQSADARSESALCRLQRIIGSL